jgi:hypothetical protein
MIKKHSFCIRSKEKRREEKRREEKRNHPPPLPSPQSNTQIATRLYGWHGGWL